jgi:hypothetical protein
MQHQNDYFAAYRSLKLNRDSEGVLVAEFHSNDGPFTFTAQEEFDLLIFGRVTHLLRRF